MNGLPPQAPLSDQLRDRIGKRRVRVAVFLTYQFDPGFFETEVLQTLFDYDWSRNRRVALAQAEDVLRQVDHITVYYDIRGIPESASAASLDYRRIGVIRPGGVFHPKNILLLLEDAAEPEESLNLLLVTTSANLTRAGWWENLEVVHMIEIPENSRSMLRDDLLNSTGLLLRVTQQDPTEYRHDGIEAIRQFLLRRTDSSATRSQDGIARPRLFVGQQPLAQFVRNELPIDTREFNLEVISPYFENTDQAKALTRLVDELQPRATRIFLPRSETGAAACAKPYFDAVALTRDVTWGFLPRSFTRYAKHEDSVDRFVHAKVYRLFAGKQEFLLVGSPNLTSAAHSQAGTGNLESAILFQPAPAKGRLDWWLTPIERGWQPESFDEASTEEPAALACHNVSFRYDWRTDTLSFFWASSAQPPNRAEVRHRSAAPFSIEELVFDQWIDLPQDTASTIRQALQSCSFLDVLAGDKPPQRVLVREEGMECKPSLAVSLSAEEILEYWSLFSAEQKSAFLSRKIEVLISKRQDTEANAESPAQNSLAEPTMFDRFAGIFHGFSCLEGLIDEALQSGNTREARCLLFGSKYDSMKTLIERITAAQDADPVNRYVTLLCGKQLIEKLEKKHGEFVSTEQSDLTTMQALLHKTIESARNALLPCISVRSAEFLTWFEKMFFIEIPAPEVEGQHEADSAY